MEPFIFIAIAFCCVLSGAVCHAWYVALRKPPKPTMKEQIEAELDSILASAINAGREAVVAHARSIQHQSLKDSLITHHKHVKAIYDAREPRT